ncbi:hypothetical protein VOLCADRAFT_99935 [Volvox carteri f. nagariensis]|uniref:HECT-type E3 ubiquitin transferase n=1 Tax=Volvox carteri f. nagariensis TaxID=3068 RepID=D8UJ09_VOLCA|nr:uncharacterized protein VOLCADRAFT_99935 [Volvox carteri f. nagariensis]EFJ40292.1 hypothetical protein VOLCADRAFT_99935 [Volvox carteri f. nagariensis]|eukprot:XP_002958626.1 hypothetical protein VOLCADRAFT_99935 [Volvox carteri f. nagariensis]
MRGLGRATCKEQTRDELLEAVRAERAARSGVKQRARSAGVIQRFWRGYRARRHLREMLISEWAMSYGPMVAVQEARLSGRDVADKLLPPLLYLLRPQPAAAAAAAAAAAQRDSRGSTAATANDDAVLLPPQGSPLSNMIRGSLALLLRTCSASDPRDSYLAIALEGDEARRVAWRDQAWRLLCTCCRLVAAPRGVTTPPQPPQPPQPPSSLSATGSPRVQHPQQQHPQGQSHGGSNAAAAGGPSAAPCGVGSGVGDPVVDAAAIRVAVLLTDSGTWKCLGQGQGGGGGPAATTGGSSSSAGGGCGGSSGISERVAAAEAATAHFRSRLVQQPHSLFAALARLLAARRQAQQQQDGGGSSTAATASPAVAGQQQQQLSRLLGLALAVLRSALVPDLNPPGKADPDPSPKKVPPPPPASELNREGSPPGCLAVCWWCGRVICFEKHRDVDVGALQVRFRSSGAFACLCRSVRQQLDERTVGDATAAAWCLANLLQLLLGPHMHSVGGTATAAAAGGGGGGRGFVGVLSPPPDSFWGAGGEVASELAATAAALMEHIMARGRLYGSPELAAAVSGLWPLAQRGLLVPMLAALESRPGGVESYTDMCCAAMELMPRDSLSAAFSEKGIRAADVPGLLNTLAFSPGLLPRLWRWLCFAVHLPLSCPAGATRCLDVAALAGGVYAQLLLVLDDGEFYELQQPLELSAARAVGTCLNSLVFHTYLPKLPSDGARAAPGPGPALGPGDPDFALLLEWAPRLLRALYERDVRRPYCQSLLWLAPYREMFGSSDEQPGPPPPPRPNHDVDDPFAAAAAAAAAAAPDPADARIGPFTAGTVLQALMYSAGAGGAGRDDEDEDGGAASGSGGGGTAPALQPQVCMCMLCSESVPFPRRVDLLRAVLAEDKRRGSEAGLDFGGLQKELLERVVSAGLDANYGLFTSTPDGLIYPNPAAERLDGGLALLEFMGLMFGKALYEGILLPVPLAHFFISRLQLLTAVRPPGRQPLFDDLASLDPELHKNLLMVKRYEGDVADLGLTFSADTDYLGCPAHHELLTGRGDMPVTNESRLLYCHLLADWHLNGKLGAPTAAFTRGLLSLIPQGCTAQYTAAVSQRRSQLGYPSASLRLFNPREFNQLLSGAAADGPGGGGGAAPLDVADMRRWTRYSGGYSPDSTTVKLFWRVVAELTPNQQSALLRFVTSCSRPPLGGFRYLQPPLTVHKVECEAGLFAALGGRDVDRLPSASTCYNMLKLPNYRRASTLKAKLLYSITSGAGFELSYGHPMSGRFPRLRLPSSLPT